MFSLRSVPAVCPLSLQHCSTYELATLNLEANAKRVLIDMEQRIEEAAKQAVARIRHFTTTIRELPEFSTHCPLNCQNDKLSRGRKPSKPLHEVRITQRLREAMAGNVRKAANANSTVELSETIIFLENIDKGEEERIELVFDFLLPLLMDLSAAYEQLDMTLPQPDSIASQCSSKAKPKAPPGLLSLADYTDIGCLLELLVATSILPKLEPNILHPAEKRIHNLPKTMKGRVPAMAFLWGSAVASRCTKVDLTSLSYTTPGFQELFNTAQELLFTALSIAKLCTMARFRPMFLPRHIVDVCAALHQSFHWYYMIQSCLKRNGGTNELGSLPLMKEWDLSFLSELGFANARPLVDSDQYVFDCDQQNSIIDRVLLVKAYQSLLSFGSKKTPDWLRRQISHRLSYLARIDLDSILLVFVHVAESLPSADMTGAATRLAQALIPNSTVNSSQADGSNEYLISILSQLADSIDTYIVSRKSQVDMSSHSSSRIRSSLAGPLTAASIIPLLLQHHKNMICKFWIERLVAPISNDVKMLGDDQISTIIQRFYVWICCTTPPTSAICALLAYERFQIKDSENEDKEECFLTGYTILQLLLRIAASAPLSPHFNMTKSIIFQILEPLVLSGQDPKSYRRLVTVAICLVHSVAVTNYDVSGPTFFAPSSNGACACRLHNHAEDNSQRILEELQARCKVAVQILHQLNLDVETNSKTFLSTHGQQSGEVSLRHRFPLSASVFEVLLLVYLTILPKRHGSSSVSEGVSLPKILQQESFKLAALNLLPILMESSGVLELLGTSAVHILRMIHYILIDGVSDICNIADLKLDASDLSVINDFLTDEDVETLSIFLSSSCSNILEYSKVAVVEQQDIEVDLTVIDSRVSMSSLCLSLLLTILELGEKHRDAFEEDCIRKFLPVVKAYAKDLDSCRIMSLEEAAKRSNMAEIAAHICALIVSRDAHDESNEKVGEPQLGFDEAVCNGLVRLITQAEQDLQSDMAPIRARGVVGLMHAARAEVSIQDHYIDQKSNVSENVNNDFENVSICAPTTEERKWSKHAIEKMLQVTVLALEDKDSYVFLAAVQTLSALCDVAPQHFLPRLAIAVSRGIIESSKYTTMEISISCRAKFAEALMFAIRRRGEALCHYNISLVNELLRGCHSNSHQVTGRGLTSLAGFLYSDEQQTLNHLIQQQTHDFLGGEATKKIDICYVDEADLKEEKHRKDLVGGPIFEVEELDTVRSGCYNCLAEIVALTSPDLVAQFIPQLVFLCLNALRLDKGRLVRRAAAYLSRELYRASLREGKGLVSQRRRSSQSFLPMTVELVSSGEVCLAATLKQIVDLKETTGYNMYDPATDARCWEALESRHLCEEYGFLSLASAMVKEMELCDHSLQNAPRMVREMLMNNKGGNGVEIR